MQTGKRFSLSKVFCFEHRSTGDTSSYALFRRHQAAFERELKELEWASVRKGPRESGAVHVMLYEFRRRIVDARDLYLLDEGIGIEARELVRLGMTDRKKLMVMMLCSGSSASEIGRRIGVSRAAAAKAIHLLPDRYSFHKQTAAY